MTDMQAQDLGSFIDNMTQEESNILFEELIGSISLYFGTMEFAEIIDNVYETLNSEGHSLEKIAEEVKKQSQSGEDIYADIAHELSDEDQAWQFAENCVQSIVFNPTYPESILEELEKEKIELTDFSMNLIVSFRESFLDIFVNEMDIEEWKGDVIDALVSSWEQ